MSSADATAAERYARAIFELGIESGDEAALVEKVGAFASVYGETPGLRNVLENPNVLAPEREAIVRAVAGRLGLTPLALNVVRYLAHRRRLRALPQIAERLNRIADERHGIVRATVTAALPLPDTFYRRLTGELEVLTGKRVLLERREDPSLIAGVVTRIGDNTIDGSLGGWLDRLGRQLEAS